MSLNVILQGPLPHDFIVIFDPEETVATYYGQKDIVTRGSVSRSVGIQNREIQSRVKSGIDFFGAGTARCDEQGVLVVGDDKTNLTVRDYGRIPGQILRLFEEQLLRKYQEICPDITSIRLEPDEAASPGYWNLPEVLRVLQAKP